jgi:hypothetical protein
VTNGNITTILQTLTTFHHCLYPLLLIVHHHHDHQPKGFGHHALQIESSSLLALVIDTNLKFTNFL